MEKRTRSAVGGQPSRGAGAIKMSRIDELKRERAFAADYLARLKAGLIETLDSEGDGPLIDRTRKTIARLTRRIAVLDALLRRNQATSATPAIRS